MMLCWWVELLNRTRLQNFPKYKYNEMLKDAVSIGTKSYRSYTRRGGEKVRGQLSADEEEDGWTDEYEEEEETELWRCGSCIQNHWNNVVYVLFYPDQINQNQDEDDLQRFRNEDDFKWHEQKSSITLQRKKGRRQGDWWRGGWSQWGGGGGGRVGGPTVGL